MEGAVGFAPSPNSIVPHNMFELEVLFDDSDPTLEGHNHGQYSLDPSHWGASIQQQGSDPLPNAIPDFECEVRDDNRILAVASTLPGDDLAVSSACVEVIGGTGGFTLVDPFIIPNSVLVDSLTVTVLVSIDIKPGSDPNSVNPRSKGKIPVAIDKGSLSRRLTSAGRETRTAWPAAPRATRMSTGMGSSTSSVTSIRLMPVSAMVIAWAS